MTLSEIAQGYETTRHEIDADEMSIIKSALAKYYGEELRASRGPGQIHPSQMSMQQAVRLARAEETRRLLERFENADAAWIESSERSGHD
jgi:hypothetical protein